MNGSTTSRTESKTSKITSSEIKKPLKQVALKSYKNLLIGNNSYIFLTKEKHHLAELMRYPLICLSPNSGTRNFYNKFYLQNQLTLCPTTEVATSNQLLPIIKAGLGIGFVPEILIKDDLAKQTVVEIPLYEKIPSREIFLLENTTRHLSVAATTLKQMLLQKYLL